MFWRLLNGLHIGENTKDVCEGLHGTGIGCPRMSRTHVGMFVECRDVYGAAALPCSASVPATGHSLRHTGTSGLPCLHHHGPA